MKQLLLLWVILLASAPQALSQNLSGKVSGGFQVPAARDDEGRRSVLKGSAGQPVGEGLIEISDPRLTSFRPDDTPDIVMEAAKCWYDTRNNVAYSDTGLSVKTPDGRFSIEGTGWRWDSSTSRLIISNNITALVRKAEIAGVAPDASAPNRSSTNDMVKVTSKSFIHEANAATFRDNVRVEDGADLLLCGRLLVNFQGEGGVQKIEALDGVQLSQAETAVQSERAIYQVKENTIELIGGAKWQSGSREGSSDRLLIERGSSSFAAQGKVFMRLPASGLVSTNDAALADKAANTNFFEVHSSQFRFTGAQTNGPPARATYKDQVKVIHPQGEIRCEQLDVLFSAENQVNRVVAQNSVEVVSGENRAFGELALYELPEDKITISIGTRWQLDETTGSSRKLVIHPRKQEFYALEDVRMLFPKGGGPEVGLFGGLTNRTDQTAEGTGMEITAHTFSHHGNISVFHQDVRVQDASGTLQSALLTVHTGASNQVERVVAQDNVRIEQNDLLATGQRADYNVDTGLIHLTGDPKIHTAERSAVAREFVIDRVRNTFRIAPGSWRITMQPNSISKSK